MEERLQRAGARTHVVPARWWVRDPGSPRRGLDVAGFRRTTRALRALAPDVVLSNTMVHPPGAVGARALGVPHLWWIHELGVEDHGFRFTLGHRPTLRLISALSAAVLHSSNTVRAALAREIGEGKLRDVPLAVDVPAVAAPDRAASRPGSGRLVLAGRIRPSKGQSDAVAALAHLPGVELDLLGDGTPADLHALHTMAERSVSPIGCTCTAAWRTRCRFSIAPTSRSSVRAPRPSGG
jgi:glycosyltransferase involved in cell wall biosynthesis